MILAQVLAQVYQLVPELNYPIENAKKFAIFLCAKLPTTEGAFMPSYVGLVGTITYIGVLICARCVFRSVQPDLYNLGAFSW